MLAAGYEDVGCCWPVTRKQRGLYSAGGYAKQICAQHVLTLCAYAACVCYSVAMPRTYALPLPNCCIAHVAFTLSS